MADFPPLYAPYVAAAPAAVAIKIGMVEYYLTCFGETTMKIKKSEARGGGTQKKWKRLQRLKRRARYDECVR